MQKALLHCVPGGRWLLRCSQVMCFKLRTTAAAHRLSTGASCTVQPGPTTTSIFINAIKVDARVTAAAAAALQCRTHSIHQRANNYNIVVCRDECVLETDRPGVITSVCIILNSCCTVYDDDYNDAYASKLTGGIPAVAR